MKEFDKNIEIDFLISELISTNERIDNNMEIPNDYEEMLPYPLQTLYLKIKR